uniref:Uncharacterized protein TCIL3000_10_8260 n=1 Tax=Trypanosoma congolense (strain IL3000) TaxID=1068625 RepID=G0UXD3_TRYCI|nr:unnamed protein product [Trypanosoma congolense IL3000]
MVGIDPDIIEDEVDDIISLSNSSRGSSNGSLSNSPRNSGASSQIVKVTAMDAVSALAHFPLGSWERHVVEEKLRAVRRHERECALRAEMEKECTFKPSVCTSFRHGKDTGGDPTEAQSKRALVFKRLAQQAKERSIRIEQKRAEKEHEEMEALRNAFRPRVNAYEDNQRASDRRSSSAPVEERLLHYGKTIENSRKMLQEEKYRQEMKEMSGGSVTARKGHEGGSKDKREGDIAFRSRNFLLNRERERALAQKTLLEKHPFRPQICATSDAIDRERRSLCHKLDRGATLYAEGIHRKQRQQVEALRHQNRESSGLHKPVTSPLNNDWIYRGQHRALFEQDFVRRQELYQQVREQHRRDLAAVIEENERKAAEVPRIDKAMIEEQIERLYLGGQSPEKGTKKYKEAASKEECSFRPQLAPWTEHVLAQSKREPDFVKRLGSCSSYKRCESSNNIFESCSGDDVGTRSKNIRTIRPEEAEEFYSKQKQAVKEREAHLREQKQRLAMEELFACTFRPKTTADEYFQRRRRALSPEKQQEQQVEACVLGVKAYLQRQAEAKRQRKELQERYENIGRVSSRGRRSSTVIKPFNLSSGRVSRTQGVGSARDLSGVSDVREDSTGYRHIDPHSIHRVACGAGRRNSLSPLRCSPR